ncbi:hypothetical protein PV704_23575 [Streptomyces scabiei]|nr:hypothetical protein [Streptomyces scabiei]MDX3479897.1 hypothetical protein [Streptomyces scabiei]
MTPTDTATALPARQTLPAEERHATELDFLAAHDQGLRQEVYRWLRETAEIRPAVAS